MPLFYLAAIVSLLADQLSKIWIRSRLVEGDSMDLIPGFIHLEYVRNFGAAWSVLSGQKWLLIILAAVVIGFIISSAREVASRGKIASLAFGLILGGAMGNLIDRILFGNVTDFFDLDTSIAAIRTFPVFNVADSALTVGVILMICTLLFGREKTDARAPSLESRPS